jgi:hypothetical protein
MVMMYTINIAAVAIRKTAHAHGELFALIDLNKSGSNSPATTVA